mmetsp:Transcript_7815/g.18266  ORF Transcript_7815/g.18266 Transcript_7815/m.18266 type:complete len:200 (-) Transcript_7815:635-1234(-)
MVFFHHVRPAYGQARGNRPLRSDAHEDRHRSVREAHLSFAASKSGSGEALQLLERGTRVVPRLEELRVDRYVLLGELAAILWWRRLRPIPFAVHEGGIADAAAEVDDGCVVSLEPMRWGERLELAVRAYQTHLLLVLGCLREHAQLEHRASARFELDDHVGVIQNIRCGCAAVRLRQVVDVLPSRREDAPRLRFEDPAH